MYQRILVPVDGSEASGAALAEAIRFARTHGAKLHIVHVYEPTLYSFPDGPIDVTNALRRDGERIVSEAAARVAEAGVDASTSVVDSGGKRIAAVIVERADAAGAELIVMGTHGRSGFEHLLLGSVAEGVARRTKIPLLLIRCTQ
jgi:nucleotide-binding universal stress UspA family protein